jgi:uncharacterized protein (DUF362 family)/ferredoxin
MKRVALRGLDNYQPLQVEAAINQLLEPLGGIGAFVRPGQKVLLKPNLLSGKAPDRAVTTHPEIVRAVISLVQRAGGIVSVGDSPGLGKPEQVARKAGLMAVIEETGAHFARFEESVPVRIGSGTFHQLELARDILDAEVIINLPKLKTHQMMGLTCGVKNLFGAVVGMRKVRLHLQAGADKEFFALMLLDLAARVAPALTIVDAVVGMEGNGPGSGDPVSIGALLAGVNPLAVDAVACALVGVKPETVWTQKIALAKRLPGADLQELELCGEMLENLKISAFRSAKTTDVNFGLPRFLKNRLKHATTARPTIDRDRCVLCGLCAGHCPPQVMTIRQQKLEIDHDACIRCFCCQELCPHGAIITEQGLLLRLHSFLKGR